MSGRIRNRVKYILERMMLRGPQYQLLVIAALIGLVSVTAGTLLFYFTHDLTFPDSVWWAFLRLTDPGYLGDDQGVAKRTISTVVTVLGYVIFLGALIAIMTQWLKEKLTELEAGLTPVALNNHFVIVGWTNRTTAVMREILLSEGRVRRFLRGRGARELRIAVLAESVTAALQYDLREQLGRLWNERQIVLRTGTPLRIEHLRRVDFEHAAAVVLPAADFAAGGPAQADTRAIKTLLSLTNQQQADSAELPLAVAEIFDARKLHVARHAYGGPIEILASDAIISRLIAQNVRNPGLSYVYGELLTHGHGNEIYIRDIEDAAGRRLVDLPPAFPEAILLGVARPDGGSFRSILNPPDDFRVEPGDRLVLIARSYERTQPVGMAQLQEQVLNATRSRSAPHATDTRRVLVLGWSHKVPALLHEFDGYADEQFAIDVLSQIPVEQRNTLLNRYEARPLRVPARQIEGDYVAPSDLEPLAPATYDAIVFIGSDWLPSGEESDARTILGYLLLREMLRDVADAPNVLVELLDPGNVPLFDQRAGEVIISPVLLSHMLAQVALRRELRAVFDELFGPGGGEIVFRPASSVGLADRAVRFSEIERVMHASGEIALGVRIASSTKRGGVYLNPSREKEWTLAAGDAVVVLTTYQTSR